MNSLLLNDEKQKKITMRWYAWIPVFSFSTIGPFSADSYIPLMPIMLDDLHGTESELAWSLLLNWIARGVSSLLISYYSDKFGRKPFVLLGLIFYIIGTIICTNSPNINYFIMARIV